MRKSFLFLLLFFVINSQVRSDEGMWLLTLIEQLNIGTMMEMGLELSAEDIYSINKACLKDAVVALDGGSCTAELISPEGLIITNHHCGYDEIQQHSSVEHDYLTDGFWAMSKEEELPNPGKTATFIIRMEDVTARIDSMLSPDMTEDDRDTKIVEISEQIILEATEGNNYKASVEQFFGGNEFYLVVSQTYRDIRLVGAPPSSIGNFGDDTDNWMWPRHTGDFSMFRIYCGPDGEPADYSEENIPLKSKHYLPVSLKGYEMGDFAMVLGFPGNTQRYLSSYGVKELLETTHPNRIKIRGIKLDIIMKDMLADDKIRIQYAAKHSASSNYWKYSIGQKKGLEDLDIYHKKKTLEVEFSQWLNENPEQKEKYGEALKLIQTAIDGRKEYQHATQYLIECFIYGGSEIIENALNFNRLYNTINNSPEDTETISLLIEEIKKEMEVFYKDYSPSTDKKVTKALLKLYREDVPEEYQINLYEVIDKKYKGNIDKYVEDIFAKTFLLDKDKVFAFLEDPDSKALEGDIAFQAALSVFAKYLESYLMTYGYETDLIRGERLFIAGLREMKPEIAFYPDANSTIRFSYGKVGDYSPKDAVLFKHYTTMKGIMEKEDPDDHEFIVPQKLKKLFEEKDFGRYAQDGVMKVCFTTDNDITGGNSGSPVINGKGELIGVAFDGNWEAMSGDVVFEKTIQKCINVDIRYVLFVIDKYAGAHHLIDEMTIVE